MKCNFDKLKKYFLSKKVIGIVRESFFVFMLSYVGFWLWKIDLWLYFPVIISALILLVICFGNRRNASFFASVSWYACINFFVYIFLLCRRWDINVFKTSGGKLCISYAATIILVLIISTKSSRQNVESKDSPPLFRERVLFHGNSP